MHCLKVFLLAQLQPNYQWLDTLQAELQTKHSLKNLIQQCVQQQNRKEDQHFTTKNGLFVWKGRLVIPRESPLINSILQDCHCSNWWSCRNGKN